MIEQRFQFALKDSEAVRRKTEALEELCREYCRSSSQPPKP